MGLYLALGAINLYRIMFPLAMIDLSEFSESDMVRPLWSKSSSSDELHLAPVLELETKIQRDLFASRLSAGRR